MRVTSWYKPVLGGPSSPYNPLTDLLAIMSASLAGAATHTGVIQSQLESSSTVSAGVTSFLGNQPANGNVPKAYLNWILFDERFNYVSSSSGSVLVPDEEISGEYIGTNTIVRTNLPIDKNGYLYIYVSNVTPNINVFFDNLQVTHVRGSLISEEHYYPFGLTQAGISSKAFNFGDPENNKKYNGIEKENALSIEIYDAQLRELDGQTGRWWQIDPKIEKMEMWSPYASNYDNPVLYSDPLGDEPECCAELWEELKSAAKETWATIKDGASDIYNKGIKPGGDWINMNLNPTVPLAEFILGKSYESNFTEKKSRISSGSELGLAVIPGGKIEGAIVKTVDKTVAKEGMEQVEKKVLAKGEKNAAKAGANETIVVTKDGVALPKGNKHKIPSNYIENPNRSGSYGVMENGKFKEKLRIDPATPPGSKGPNTSHYHLDGKGKHYSPNGKDKDPGF